jgi:hypothetical protein
MVRAPLIVPDLTVPTRGRGVCALLAAVLVMAHALPASADEASAKLARYNGLIDEATDHGLSYLVEAQLEDGSYESAAPMATTSLCVLAFLSKGNRPGIKPYGETMNRAIDFVVRNQRKDGLLCTRTCATGPMYDHAISTLMLTQVNGMVDPARQKRVERALGHAVTLLLNAQNVKKKEGHQGGWRYTSKSNDSDISLTGWCLMSLRSARAAGFPVPKKAVDDATAFVLRCRNGTGFGYWPGAATTVERTGVGLICLELAGHHRNPVCRAAAGHILKHFREEGDFIYYRSYYCGHAMFQFGGKEWEAFAPRMYRMLLWRQKRNGSWPTEGTQAVEAKAGPAYATAMSVLALSTTYRQLPIFQR